MIGLEYLAYVKQSFFEFDKVKVSYKQWVPDFDREFEKKYKLGYEFKECCIFYKLPLIDIKIQKDEVEGLDEIDPDEW